MLYRPATTCDRNRVVSDLADPWQESIDFVYSPQGAGLFFPETYESFVKALPSDERSNLIGSYAKRLDSPDLEVGIWGYPQNWVRNSDKQLHVTSGYLT